MDSACKLIIIFFFGYFFFCLAEMDSFFLLFCFKNSMKCTHLNDGWLTCNGIAWLYLSWFDVACAYDNNNNALVYSRIRSLKMFHPGLDISQSTPIPHFILHFPKNWKFRSHTLLGFSTYPLNDRKASSSVQRNLKSTRTILMFVM